LRLAPCALAAFVVVDISGGRKAVYYEAGFAAGLGVPIIWTGLAQTFDDDKCFDTQQPEAAPLREPNDIIAEIAALDAESAEILEGIRGML